VAELELKTIDITEIEELFLTNDLELDVAKDKLRFKFDCYWLLMI